MNKKEEEKTINENLLEFHAKGSKDENKKVKEQKMKR